MSANRRRTPYLTITGLLLIAAALGLTVYNLYDDVRAMESAASVVQQLAELTPEETQAPGETAAQNLSRDDPAEPEIPREMPVKVVDGQAYIGTIKLPRYQLALPVISEWSYPRLKIAPCRYEGSVYTDDLIISAHNYHE